jgi:hypothetical protein
LTPFVAIVFDLITNSTDAFGGTYDFNMNMKKPSTILPSQFTPAKKKKCMIFPKLNKAPRHEQRAGTWHR